MAWTSPKRPDELQQIVQTLSLEFPIASIRVYRYNPASIRIRIIDERFSGRSITEREEMILPLPRTLPEGIQTDITVLLTLAPGELGKSLMNQEFEHPTPSPLL